MDAHALYILEKPCSVINKRRDYFLKITEIYYKSVTFENLL